MKKHLAVYYLLAGDTRHKYKNELTTDLSSKLSLIYRINVTFLCLLRLCGNREYPGSFQNKALSSKLFQMKERKSI